MRHHPGRWSATAGAHFANPRNDFWRLLHDAGFTPRLLAPEEQHELPSLGYGLTNAAHRTTPGSGDLRRSDFAGSGERLERIAAELRPGWIALVGKEAYRDAFGVKIRKAVRAVVLDPGDRTILVHFDFGHRSVWATPGGGIDEGESDEHALRRELAEELGLQDPDIGPCVWTREHIFQKPLGHYDGQRERYYLIRTERFEPTPHLSEVELRAEYVTALRWWSIDEIEASDEAFAPTRLAELLRELVEDGPPAEPVDVGF